ncbi:MAG: hypothetical protein R2758_11835 [Bacteroidales bacterium]
MIFELPTFKVRQQLSSFSNKSDIAFHLPGSIPAKLLFSFPGILQEELILNYIAYLPDCHKNFRIGGVQRVIQRRILSGSLKSRDDDGSAHLRIYKGFADKGRLPGNAGKPGTPKRERILRAFTIPAS